jgi:hypothetical protein
MKQCPKCSRTYANDKQKFCTKDGTALVDAQQSRPHDETVRIDSTPLDDEMTKFISRDLPPMEAGGFDPYKTNVSSTPPQSPSPSGPSQPIPPPPAVEPPAPAKPSAPEPPESPAPASAAFDPFRTTIATSNETATAPPDLSKTIGSPTAAAPPKPAPAVSAPEPPAPSLPRQKEPGASLPTIASLPSLASVTGNIGTAQATNASLPAETVPPVTKGGVPETASTAAIPQPSATAKKRSKLPLILGVLFVLLFLGVGLAVAGYFLFPVIKPMLTKRSTQVEPRHPEPTPIVVSTPDIGVTNPETPKIEVPAYSPPADAVQFVNSIDKLNGKLADHYVDFSFYYPNRWRKDPEAGTAVSTNFAKVQRQLAADAPQEIFAVGWYDSTGEKEADQASFPRLAGERSAQFAKSYPEYKKVSEGPVKAGPYDAYEFRFSGAYRNTDRGDIQIWGRVMFVPPVEGKRGVTLLMLASSLAPEVKSIDDVGVKGELPMMLESFRFAK